MPLTQDLPSKLAPVSPQRWSGFASISEQWQATSHWHKVHGSSEVWLYHSGAPIRLKLSKDGKSETGHLLGIDLAAGERPQLIVPAGWWQAAETLGDWTLVSCTVAPGFLFENFELAPPGWTPNYASLRSSTSLRAPRR